MSEKHLVNLNHFVGQNFSMDYIRPYKYTLILDHKMAQIFLLNFHII